MREIIKNFNRQFEYEPRIENADNLSAFSESFARKSRSIVAGMGGSNLAAGLLKIIKPEIDIVVHRNYGLPAISKAEIKNYLFIASSYSGNTEETIDGFFAAGKNGLPRIAISTGGKLLELTQKEKTPHIQLKTDSIQPRLAIGYNFLALLKAVGKEELLREAHKLVSILKPKEFEPEGQVLAKKIGNKIPVIYASFQNEPLAYYWKVNFNETVKIPVFYTSFPELNHNDMAGFEGIKNEKELAQKFYFIFFKDKNDHPQIVKRMEILERLYKESGFEVDVLELKDTNPLEKIFSSIIFNCWAAYYLAQERDVKPEDVEFIEKFKKLIA